MCPLRLRSKGREHCCRGRLQGPHRGWHGMDTQGSHHRLATPPTLGHIAGALSPAWVPPKSPRPQGPVSGHCVFSFAPSTTPRPPSCLVPGGLTLASCLQPEPLQPRRGLSQQQPGSRPSGRPALVGHLLPTVPGCGCHCHRASQPGVRGVPQIPRWDWLQWAGRTACPRLPDLVPTRREAGTCRRELDQAALQP